MTDNQALRILEVFTAFANGKKIQSFIITKNIWVDELNPDFSITKDWRIKPEPKLVPFTFEDNLLFRDKWIRFKDTKTFLYKIISIGNLFIRIADKQDKVVEYTYLNLLELFEFEDGSPCGKYINE
jgi:hypothetical protein